VVSADGPVPELLPAVCDCPGPLPGSLPATRELLLGANTIKGNLTLCYTRGLGRVVLHVMVPQLYGVPLAFQHRYGNFTILKDLFQMGEGYVAKQRGRGLPVGLGAGAD
jgi:hypothetical protein